MPLSEHEQRLLEQIERALYAEDPKFASSVSGGRMSKPARRRRIQGALLFVLGLVLLVAGVAVQSLWIGDVPGGQHRRFPGDARRGVAGGDVHRRTQERAAKEGQQSSSDQPADDGNSGFTNRMEERFRRRFEQE